jgi:tungstate transport system substrate-binding protein
MKPPPRIPSILLALFLLLFLAKISACERKQEQTPALLLATTTSVRDTGLLDLLLPDFTERSGILVRVIAVGSGAALRMGEEGNADLLLTHAPAAEQHLLESGAVLSRRPFMENHFVIAGPPEDPADVKGAASPIEAIRRIVRSGAPYVSRGDDSGTHMRERALLEAAHIDDLEPLDWKPTATTGSGMGITLQVAGERRAYTLSDLGSFLAFRDRIGLEALSQPGDELRNVYSLLRVDPARFPGRIQAEAASRLEAFLLSAETLARIAEYGRERFGRPLFRPLEPSP